MNNNRRKKEMALFIGAISLALSIILLGGTGAFGQTLTTLHDFGINSNDGQNPQAGWCSTSRATFTALPSAP